MKDGRRLRLAVLLKTAYFMTYDLFTFFNELDLLELRLSILDEHVDQFILTESTETFSRQPKSLYYQENKERFAKWNHKIIHNIVGKFETDNAFKRAAYQKNDALKLINDPEALIYFGDTDEIWEPSLRERIKLRQYNYCYYLNQRSSEDWYGTVVGRRKDFQTLTEARETWERVTKFNGWHFTNMGGLEQLTKKIEAYDHQEANIPWVKDNLAYRMQKGQDYLGRGNDYQGKPFNFFVDENDWPRYLKDNKQKYQHLCK